MWPKKIMWPFDSQWVTSYRWSIVTICLSWTVTKIWHLKYNGVTTFDLLGSCDVIGHVTIQLGICGFLLLVHCIHASILHHYGDIAYQRQWGHELTLLGSRDVIGHVTIWLSIRGPTGGPLWPCIYLAPLGRYKASNLHLPMLKAKTSLRMSRVTWPVGRGSKITAYLEFPWPHCLFTMPLLWGYNDN